MSASHPSPGQPEAETGQRSTLPAAVREHGGRSRAKLAGAVALVIGGLVILGSGIALGNAARKRVDRWAHGY